MIFQTATISSQLPIKLAFSVNLLLALVSTTGCAAATTTPTSNFTQICATNEVAEAAAKAAKQAFPALPTNLEERTKRSGFLYHNRLKLLDQNNDGMLDFNEYAEEQWAFYLSYLPDNVCIVSKANYLAIFLGDPSDARNILWRNKNKVREFTDIFNALDHDKKGYLVKDNFLVEWKGQFKSMDRNHDGKLYGSEE